MSPITNKAEAFIAFKELIGRYGLQWPAQVPRGAYDRLNECNKFLTEADRRSVLTNR